MTTSLKPFGKESSYSTVKWTAEFMRGRESVEDYKLPWHPKEATIDENVEHVHSLIMCDRRRSLRDIGKQIGVSFGAVQSILTHISGMFKVSARWVPRMMTKDQKKSRLFLSISCLSMKMTLRNLCLEL